MNQFSRIFSVVAAFGSLLFMAASMAIVSGGPNWNLEADHPALSEDLTLTSKKEGNTPTVYTLVVRRPEGSANPQIESGPLLPKVLIKGKEWKLNQQAARTKLSNEVAQFQEGQITNKKVEIEKDIASFDSRRKVLSDYVVSLESQLGTALEEHRKVTLQNEAVIKQVRERVAEAYRLQNQLELVRDDLYAAEEQKKALDDELLLLDELADRLERRNEQLKKMTYAEK